MLRPSAPDLKVYLHRAPIDMRAGRNGLAAIAHEVMRQDPFGKTCFVFININGFSLWSKVIESREKFAWPRLFQEEVVELTSEQLHWLMDGYDVWARPHTAVTFTHVS